MNPWNFFQRLTMQMVLAGTFPLLGATVASAAAPLPAPQGFRQEIPKFWPLPEGVTAGSLRLLHLDAGGGVWVADGKRWFKAQRTRTPTDAAPVIRPERGTWTAEATAPDDLPASLAGVRQVLSGADGAWLVLERGVRHAERGVLDPPELTDVVVHQLAITKDGRLLAATPAGLRLRGRNGWWRREPVRDAEGRDWAAGGVRAVTVDPTGTWWVGTPAGVAAKKPHAETWTTFTGRDGVPWADFTCAAAGPDGTVWFGTHRGAVRFDGRDWAYREGPAWLPGNDVRAVATGPDGTTWFLTDVGLGCLESRPMTLAEKAAFYEDEMERYIRRTPLGYVAESLLGAPGDRSHITHLDSDNDGLWTAMYGAGECFGYAATKQPELKRRAWRAFEALRFLQTVTQGGPHSPPPGFVARTILPTDGRDPNAGQLERDREVRAKHDRLWKVMQPRWPRSADGKWYWKSDTSSDELDGHFFFYAACYDLVAETEEERAAIRKVVDGLAGHLLTHDFCLVDHDGRPTRWAVFGPRYLNDDPDWWVERGLNSLSILSYLAVAAHVTGQPRYLAAFQDLVERHHYGANVMNFKTQTGVGSGNQSDDEMAFMCFYNLLRYAPESEWKRKWRLAFYAAWALEQPELNPFFHFAYAGLGRGQTYANAFGTIPLDPWDGWLEDSLATLRGLPLDRADWARHNSHRLDLRWLPRQQARDLASTDLEHRAVRTTGKVLPVAERHFNHWNTDPWRPDYPGNGRVLGNGTVFLLPYYLGLYHRFIELPSAASRQ